MLLLLETGIKKEELFELKIIHFDLSNKYAPELWVKHTGKKVKKDRKLKLPPEIVPVFADYVKQYSITDMLFPYTPRFIEMLLSDTAKEGRGEEKSDCRYFTGYLCCPESKTGRGDRGCFEKIGLSETTWEDAREVFEVKCSRDLSLAILLSN